MQGDGDFGELPLGAAVEEREDGRLEEAHLDFIELDLRHVRDEGGDEIVDDVAGSCFADGVVHFGHRPEVREGWLFLGDALGELGGKAAGKFKNEGGHFIGLLPAAAQQLG